MQRTQTHARRTAVTLLRAVRNAILDLRFGAPLTGTERSRFRSMGSRDVANSDYGALDRVFEGRIRPDDVLVDVGCGKGRVINWWLRNGNGDQRIHGLELDPAVAARTARRLRRHHNVTIHAGDARDTLPADSTLLFLYNPFDHTVMAPFVERVDDCVPPTTDLRILYVNPKQLHLFDPGRWRIELVPAERDAALPYDDLAVISRRTVLA